MHTKGARLLAPFGKEIPRPKTGIQSAKLACLGGVDEKIVERIRAFFLALVGDFLTLDAVSRPGYSVKSLDADVFLAMQAGTESTFVNAVQSGSDVAQHVRFTIQVANRQLALGCILDFIQRIRALLDSDPFTVSQHLRQLSLFSFQDFFKFV
jgi:hypothetical protein